MYRALVGVLALSAFAHGCRGREHPFEVVSGFGYEGAIVPGSMVPARLLASGDTSWWPQPDDVAVFEAQFAVYLRRAAQGAMVSPSIEFQPDQPPRDLAELQLVVRELPRQPRQYFGIVSNGRRLLRVHSFPGTADFSSWRDHVLWGVDYGCGMWSVIFDMTNRKIEAFYCQGSA